MVINYWDAVNKPPFLTHLVSALWSNRELMPKWHSQPGKGSPHLLHSKLAVNDLIVLGGTCLLKLRAVVSFSWDWHVKHLEKPGWGWEGKGDQSSAWYKGEEFQRSGDQLPFPSEVWPCGLCSVSQQWGHCSWLTSGKCSETKADEYYLKKKSYK